MKKIKTYTAVAAILLGTSLAAEDMVCTQVITSAKNPLTGECKSYPTPCDVPSGWEKVGACAVPISATPIEYCDKGSLEACSSPIVATPISSLAVNIDSAGWHLLGAVGDINDMSYFDKSCVGSIFTYNTKNGSWNLNRGDTKEISSIKSGEGYWLYAKEACYIELSKPAMPMLTQKSVELGVEFDLRVSQVAIMNDNEKRMELRFESSNDSRCPSDVVCITDGTAKISLKVTGTLELIENVEIELGSSKTSAQGYTIAFNKLEPYPTSAQNDNKTKTAFLTIKRAN